MRIGFDASPLARPHPPGVVRAVAGALAALERTPGITALALAPSPKENLRVWRHVRLPTLVKERGLVGLHSFVSAFPMLGPGARVQTVHELPWLHGVRENAGLGHRFWARLGARRADRVVCPSAFVASELERGPIAGRVRVCPWGVDAESIASAPLRQGHAERVRRIRARLGIGTADELASGAASPEPSPLVAALGAVRRKKNLRALLEALARPGGEFARARLAVTGLVGPEAEEDRREAQRLGVEGRVHWLGVLAEEDLHALLHASDVVAVVSRSEGFGFPVLEAFAAGRPVVVARGGAAAELAGSLGIEADPGDVSELRAALARACGAAEHAPELARARLARAQEHSWARCAARIAEIWRELP